MFFRATLPLGWVPPEGFVQHSGGCQYHTRSPTSGGFDNMSSGVYYPASLRPGLPMCFLGFLACKMGIFTVVKKNYLNSAKLLAQCLAQ